MIDKLPAWLRLPVESLVAASRKFGKDRAGRMSAAIAYRTVFALAPMLIIAISLAGFFLGSAEEALAQLLERIESIGGPELADAMAEFLATAVNSADTAALVGLVLLLWSASSLFIELQHDLNDIFDVPYDRIRGLIGLVRKRGIGFLWAFGLGIVMIILLLGNAVMGFLGSLLPAGFENLDSFLTYLTPLVSLAVLPFVFGLIMKTLTDATLPWRAAWRGGLFTAVVFMVAAYGIGLYFKIFGSPTALGFAGSLVVVLFTAYMLASVFLFGAEVTKVYADHLTTTGVEDSGGGGGR